MPTARAHQAHTHAEARRLEALSRVLEKASCSTTTASSRQPGTQRAPDEARCGYEPVFHVMEIAIGAQLAIKAGLGHTGACSTKRSCAGAAAKVVGRAVPTQSKRSATSTKKLRTAARKQQARRGIGFSLEWFVSELVESVGDVWIREFSQCVITERVRLRGTSEIPIGFSHCSVWPGVQTFDDAAEMAVENCFWLLKELRINQRWPSRVLATFFHRFDCARRA